jgi:hypothetical protein
MKRHILYVLTFYFQKQSSAIEPKVIFLRLLCEDIIEFGEEFINHFWNVGCQVVHIRLLYVLSLIIPDLKTFFSTYFNKAELVSMHTKEGLSSARGKGKKLGRPKGSVGMSKLDGKTEEIKRLLALGVSKGAIARIIGVERGTLNHFVISRGLIED